MKTSISTIRKSTLGTLAIGLAAVLSYQAVQAQRQPPSEHKGLGVNNLGVISERSLTEQIGLQGYKMQLREISIMPGGQIARHDHFKRPGLVWTLSGSVVEGRPGGEKIYRAASKEAILEDATTDHWFWNDGNEEARILVCDLVPAE
jgi:quercetin dioxygenase-like cupin family protein